MGSQSDVKYKEEYKQKPSKNPYFFFVLVILWEVAVGIILGIFFGYDVTFQSQGSYLLNIYTTIILLLFLVAGFTLMSAYVVTSAVSNMLFSILLFFLTLQNWFIYRCFWNKVGLGLDPIESSFNGEDYKQISFLPTGNDRQTTDAYLTASLYEAIGAGIAMFCAMSPLFGRVGPTEVLLLSWFGPFMYEINSEIFNKFFIADNGFGMRGFLFGGITGLLITLIIGKREEAASLIRYSSSYHVQALCFIGTIMVCIGYPIVVSTGLLTSAGADSSLVAVVQLNSWLSIGASVVGAYTASSLLYKKLYMHDITFTALSGAIAFSSSSDINFNPAVPIAVGSFVGFICSLGHTPFKSAMNKNGVRLSNDVFFQFIVPGIIASCISAVLQAVDETVVDPVGYTAYRMAGRTAPDQAAWQLMGLAFSLGSAIITGVILGVIMRLIHRPVREEYFSDSRFVIGPKRDAFIDREEDRNEYHTE